MYLYVCMAIWCHSIDDRYIYINESDKIVKYIYMYDWEEVIVTSRTVLHLNRLMVNL